MAGATKIARVLGHIRTENERERVGAVVFIGDCVEEPPRDLYAAAAASGVPLFIFQEGDSLAFYTEQDGEPHTITEVEPIFRELARVTGGAFARFDAGAAGKLRELLQAVAAFAVGGVKALSNQKTDTALKLLGQLK